MAVDSEWEALCKEERDARAAHAAVVENKGLTIAESVEQEAAAREEHTKVLERMEAALKVQREKAREQTYGSYALQEYVIREKVRAVLGEDRERGRIWSVEELQKDGWKKVDIQGGGEGWRKGPGSSG